MEPHTVHALNLTSSPRDMAKARNESTWMHSNTITKLLTEQQLPILFGDIGPPPLLARVHENVPGALASSPGGDDLASPPQNDMVDDAFRSILQQSSNDRLLLNNNVYASNIIKRRHLRITSRRGGPRRTRRVAQFRWKCSSTGGVVLCTLPTRK